MATTWGSREAEDLFKIATRIAGFNARELMLEIHKRQRGRNASVNVRTVLGAMQAVRDRRLVETECTECGGTGRVIATCAGCGEKLTEGSAADGSDEWCRSCEEADRDDGRKP